MNEIPGVVCAIAAVEARLAALAAEIASCSEGSLAALFVQVEEAQAEGRSSRAIALPGAVARRAG